MHNKKTFKIYLVFFIIAIFLGLLGFRVLESLEFKKYRDIYNSKLSSIVEVLLEEYPGVEKGEILDILASGNVASNDYLKKYGIDVASESVLVAQDKLREKFLRLNILYLGLGSLVFVFIFILYDKHKEKKVREITRLLEEINRKNYALNIDGNEEDELSILKNELSKVTIMLKEEAENALKDKVSLKDSLDDISHQLKTPLTSIMISLDNILDNPSMSEDKRDGFLHSIKRETSNINFLVQNILKLTKFDTNTIDFSPTMTKVQSLIEESVQNVSPLADLKGVDIVVKKCENLEILCDKRWQIEALSNIIKNAVEHSKKGEVVEIEAEQNKVYSSIAVKNNGVIAEGDIKHIFDRFYRGSNPSSDGVGIGLSLAKSIVSKDGGTITLKSSSKDGTIFEIKYFHFNK